MDWIEGQLDNESLFPQKLGNIRCHVCTLSQLYLYAFYIYLF